MSEAAQDVTIKRGQILVVIPNESEADGNPDLHPEATLAAGPLGLCMEAFDYSMPKLWGRGQHRPWQC